MCNFFLHGLNRVRVLEVLALRLIWGSHESHVEAVANGVVRGRSSRQGLLTCPQGCRSSGRPKPCFSNSKTNERMVQTAADIIHTMLTETVQTWPSLDQSPQFDVAMIEACVGTDDYRHHLSMLQWGASQVQRIATQNNRKIIRTARIELMHEAERSLWAYWFDYGSCWALFEMAQRIA